MSVRVLGIDPGIQRSGYAVIDAAGRERRVVEAGTISTDTRATLPQRLRELYEQLEAILQEHHPEYAAVEALYAHYRHPRTVIVMGHARGVILLAMAQHDLPVLDMPATQVKQHLTGNGRASKEQVQRAVQITLGLAELPKPSDLADACAIALAAVDAQHAAVAAGGAR